MSSTHSTPGDRDFEAIHRAQRAHEPSMEEILASIRNMIADDSAKAPLLKAPQPAPTPTPQAVEAEPAADAGEPSADPLLSSEANEAVALSFGALSANLEVRSAELADSMVRDMLRPMVKEWLDDNLPAMVERLVRDEIQRIARGRK